MEQEHDEMIKEEVQEIPAPVVTRELELEVTDGLPELLEALERIHQETVEYCQLEGEETPPAGEPAVESTWEGEPERQEKQ